MTGTEQTLPVCATCNQQIGPEESYTKKTGMGYRHWPTCEPVSESPPHSCKATDGFHAHELDSMLQAARAENERLTNEVRAVREEYVRVVKEKQAENKRLRAALDEVYSMGTENCRCWAVAKEALGV